MNVDASQARREAIVNAGRRMLGTPFVHQGRAPGVGVDCIGLLSCAARAAGMDPVDATSYPRHPTGPSLLDGLARNMARISRPDDPAALEADANALDLSRHGDVLVFWRSAPDRPCHVGLRTDRGLLHTWTGIGKVVEHSIDSWWGAHVHSAWRF